MPEYVAWRTELLDPAGRSTEWGVSRMTEDTIPDATMSTEENSAARASAAVPSRVAASAVRTLESWESPTFQPWMPGCPAGTSSSTPKERAPVEVPAMPSSSTTPPDSDGCLTRRVYAGKRAGSEATASIPRMAFDVRKVRFMGSALPHALRTPLVLGRIGTREKKPVRREEEST